MNDETAPASVRVTAANSLLDRAYGRPAQGARVEDEPEPETTEMLMLSRINPGDEDFEPLAQ